jgi:hypothetical protein
LEKFLPQSQFLYLSKRQKTRKPNFKFIFCTI